MTRLTFTVLMVLCIPPAAAAQDWRAELSQDLVQVASGRMTMDEIGLLRLTVQGFDPAQYQLRFHAEAPAGGVISRDSFVGIATMMQTLTLLTLFAEAYQVSASQFLDGWDYTELESAIGTPDLELNLFMTDEGMQFEFVNTASGQRSRWTSTWDEVFEK